RGPVLEWGRVPQRRLDLQPRRSMLVPFSVTSGLGPKPRSEERLARSRAVGLALCGRQLSRDARGREVQQCARVAAEAAGVLDVDATGAVGADYILATRRERNARDFRAF